MNEAPNKADCWERVHYYSSIRSKPWFDLVHKIEKKNLYGLLFKSLGSVRFFKEMNTLSSKKDTLIWPEVTIKTFIMSQNFYFKSMLFFWSFYSSKNPRKKNVAWFPQKYEAARLFLRMIIIRNVSWAANQHIEWFLKDHVTLKTGVMMLKIQLYITGINYISRNIQIK